MHLGISNLRKACGIAEAHDAVVACHQAQSPLCTAINAHLHASIPNFLVQENFDDGAEPWTWDLLSGVPRVERGYLSVPVGAGLGRGAGRARGAQAPLRADELPEALRGRLGSPAARVARGRAGARQDTGGGREVQLRSGLVPGVGAGGRVAGGPREDARGGPEHRAHLRVLVGALRAASRRVPFRPVRRGDAPLRGARRRSRARHRHGAAACLALRALPGHGDRRPARRARPRDVADALL